MKTRIFVAMWLATACSLVGSQEPAPKASLQVCDDATRDYDAAVRDGDAAATAAARTRVLKACYQGSGRAPVLQKPISIGTDHKAGAPVKPAMPAMAIPGEPSVLTTCDGGGCWDNLGRRYNYNGTGPTLIGPTGRLCTRTGDKLECL